MTKQTRRSFVKTATASAATIALAVPSELRAEAKIHETNVISHLKHRYHGWPTLAKQKDGGLLLVCSGGRDSHVCPFGRVELMRSSDKGASWTWPEVVMDGPIDDRDAGVLETAKGTILITTFTSLAYEPSLNAALKARNWASEKLNRWKAAGHRIDAEQRQQCLGNWMVRSTDGGKTWSGRFDSIVNSPHGPIQLSDGRLLYAGKELWKKNPRIGVAESLDDGATWRWLAEIPTRAGDRNSHYHELHAVESKGGLLIAHIRNHNSQNAGETLQTESSDGGKTWSTPHSIGVWGLPSHLLRLHDGRLLMSYGYRRAPFGNQARVSDDGKTWSAPITVSSDGAGGDLGYASSVELSPGEILTVWYEKRKSSPFAQLRQARWSLG